MISDQALQELKEVFLKERGCSPKDEELVEFGTKLLTLFDVVYRPIKKDWLDEHKKLPQGNNLADKNGAYPACPEATNDPLKMDFAGKLMDQNHKKR